MWKFYPYDFIIMLFLLCLSIVYIQIRLLIYLFDSDLDRNVTQLHGNVSDRVCYHSIELASVYLLLMKQ